MADGAGRPWCPAPGAAYEVAELGGRGRGLRAVRPLEAGEVLLAVPVAECWPDAVRARELLLGAGAPSEEMDPLSDEALVALWLCRELQLGAASPLAGHLALLPRELDTVLQWTEEEAEWLRGSCFCEAAMGLREESENEWGLLSSAGGRWLAWAAACCPEGLDRGRFLWAKGAVLSRQLDLGEFFPDGAKTVVPGFDLLNHDPEWCPSCEVDVVGADDGGAPCVVVRCTRAVAAGEELLSSYGPLPNASLLMTHGFVVPENPFDCMEFVLSFPVPPARRPWLRAISDAAAAAAEDHGRMPAFEVVAGDLGDPDPAAELVTRHDLYRSDPLPPSLLALLRLRELPDEALAALGGAAAARAGQGLLAPPGALAAAGERAAVQRARGILQGLAAANGAAPCAAAGAARPCGPRAAMAAAVRAAEAELLAAAVASLGAA